MVRKLVTASTAVVLAIGMVAIVGSGVASAKGGRPTPGTATGTSTCNFHGTLAVSDTGTVSVRGNLTPHHVPACSNKGGTKLKTGHLSGLASSGTITGICNMLTGGSLADLSGGTIGWSPKHTAAASTGIALTGGTISTLVGTDSSLQVAYTGGSVADGSFMNASGVSLQATSQQTTAELTVECALGPVHSIPINGSLTL
jgi:hypothetical protein